MKNTNCYGATVFNESLKEYVKAQNTKVGNKVLKIMERPYFPGIQLNEGKAEWRYEWSPFGECDFPDYADAYIKSKMQKLGYEYNQGLPLNF